MHFQMHRDESFACWACALILILFPLMGELVSPKSSSLHFVHRLESWNTLTSQWFDPCDVGGKGTHCQGNCEHCNIRDSWTTNAGCCIGKYKELIKLLQFGARCKSLLLEIGGDQLIYSCRLFLLYKMPTFQKHNLLQIRHKWLHLLANMCLDAWKTHDQVLVTCNK